MTLGFYEIHSEAQLSALLHFCTLPAEPQEVCPGLGEALRRNRTCFGCSGTTKTSSLVQEYLRCAMSHCLSPASSAQADCCQRQLHKAQGLHPLLVSACWEGKAISSMLACSCSRLGSPDLATGAGHAVAPLLPDTSLPGEHRDLSCAENGIIPL